MLKLDQWVKRILQNLYMCRLFKSGESWLEGGGLRIRKALGRSCSETG